MQSVQSSEPCTPLTVAAVYDNIEIVRVLLAHPRIGNVNELDSVRLERCYGISVKVA